MRSENRKYDILPALRDDFRAIRIILSMRRLRRQEEGYVTGAKCNNTAGARLSRHTLRHRANVRIPGKTREVLIGQDRVTGEITLGELAP